MTKYYAVVEEVRKTEFTFTDEDMKELGSEFSNDEHYAANVFAGEELEITDKIERYVDVHTLDEGVE